MQSLLRLFILTASVLLMSGCGVRYAYSQLDWLAPRYVSEFVTLDKVQRAALDSRLEEVLGWHCADELPGYAEALRSLEASLTDKRLRGESVSHFVEQAEAAWERLTERLTPHASALLLSLKPEQIDELQHNFERRNDEQRKEYLSPNEAERIKLRAERMEKQLRRWFGRLDPSQRHLIDDWSAGLQPTTEAWLANRIEWQNLLLAALRSTGDNEQQRRPAVEALFQQPDAHWDATYRAAFDTNRAHTIALLSSLHETASDSQRNHLSRRITGYAEQFETLSRCRRQALALTGTR